VVAPASRLSYQARLPCTHTRPRLRHLSSLQRDGGGPSGRKTSSARARSSGVPSLHPRCSTALTLAQLENHRFAIREKRVAIKVVSRLGRDQLEGDGVRNQPRALQTRHDIGTLGVDVWGDLMGRQERGRRQLEAAVEAGRRQPQRLPSARLHVRRPEANVVARGKRRAHG